MSQSSSNATSALHAGLDLSVLDGRAFTARQAMVNEAFVAARQVHRQACQALGETLTEQIARQVLAAVPGAHALQVRAEPIVCGCPADAGLTCPGHGVQMVPGLVLDDCGLPIADLPVFSPVAYWLERLSEVLEPVDATLVVAERSWYPRGA
jgi:hypothetical protein